MRKKNKRKDTIMILCTCEKPSVAKDIAKALGANISRNGYYEGNGYIVTWAVGHLIGLCYPEEYDERYKKWDLDALPILPETFKTKILPNTKSQFYIVKNLIKRNDIDFIINCGDAGREGEYIQRLIYETAGNNHPVKRLWLSSFTESEIKRGFSQLMDSSKKDNLYMEAKSRTEADWLVGMNMSRLFTLRYNTTLRIGRVQTPTLKLIVDLDNKIENFKPEPFYEIYADSMEGFQGKWFSGKETRFLKQEDAQKIADKCNGKSGLITYMETKPLSVAQPLLYSLDTLQKEANRLFNYSASQILTIAQNLYEKHKLTTYPRTDSNYLSTEMKNQIPYLLQMIGMQPGYEAANELIQKGLNITNRIINDSKISDHHAIIVTENIGNYNLSLLNDAERNILNMIITRMLSAVSSPFIYEETRLIAEVEDETFFAKTKRICDLGFKTIESNLLGIKLPKDMKEFHVNKGDKITIKNILVKDKMTTPPKPFTEGTLIDAMKNIKKYISDEKLKEAVKERGLGTVATRASIIDKLKESGYIIEIKKGKKTFLQSTAKGRQLISLIPETISSPELTAEWEEKLERIEKGAYFPDDFIKEIKIYISQIVKEYGKLDNSVRFETLIEKEVIGTCPFCGAPIYESKKNYYCSDYKNCKFVLWKNNKFFEKIGFNFTKKHAKKLLKDQRTLAKNLTSKKGTKYDAWISVEWGLPYHKFKISFN